MEGRRNRKPSRKILDLFESAGQRPVSAAVGPEVAAAAVGPEVAAAAGPEFVAAAKPEVRPEVTSAARKRGTAAKRRSTGDGAGGTGIEEPLYKSVQVRYPVNEDERNKLRVRYSLVACRYQPVPYLTNPLGNNILFCQICASCKCVNLHFGTVFQIRIWPEPLTIVNKPFVGECGRYLSDVCKKKNLSLQ